MLDAAELARHLTDADDWREAVRNYEAEMFQRVIEPASFAAEAVATELSHLGHAPMIAHMKAHVAARAAMQAQVAEKIV